MNSGAGTFQTPTITISTYLLQQGGKEEVPPWNGHSPKGRRSDGVWGLNRFVAGHPDDDM